MAARLELPMMWGRKRKPEKANQRALVSAFLDAEIQDDPKKVRELLKAGLDLKARYDGTGRAALHLCAQGGSVKIAEVLIEHGADVNSLDPWGMSTVAIAARWGKTDVLGFFLKAGVDPNLADLDGTTPLLHAMCSDEDRTAHIRMLLEHGADPDKADDKGRAARDLATTLSQLAGRARRGYSALLPPKHQTETQLPRPPRKQPTATDIGVRISTSSERLSNAQLFADMFEVGQDLRVLSVHRLTPALSLPRGHLVASDYLDVLDATRFAVKLARGEYTVYVVRAPGDDSDEGPLPKGMGTQYRTAFARVQFTNAPAVQWEPAQLLGSPTWYGFGVDHGMAAFFDEGARDGLQKLSADVRWPDAFWEATAESGHDWAHVSFDGGSAVICSTGWGDGSYCCYVGHANDGSPCCLVADFQVMEWKQSAHAEADSAPVDRIKANAALVEAMAREQLDADIKFDEAAVRWLDGFIQRQHEHGRPENHEGLMNTLGSFLGECVIRTFGGTWAQFDGSWGVRFDEKNAVFPFAKVLKQLQHGAGDSVLSFFTLIPRVFSGKLPPRP